MGSVIIQQLFNQSNLSPKDKSEILHQIVKSDDLRKEFFKAIFEQEPINIDLLTQIAAIDSDLFRSEINKVRLPISIFYPNVYHDSSSPGRRLTTALHYAAYNNNLELIQFLLNFMDAELTDQNGLKAIDYIDPIYCPPTNIENPACFELLVDNGCQPVEHSRLKFALPKTESETQLVARSEKQRISEFKPKEVQTDVELELELETHSKKIEAILAAKKVEVHTMTSEQEIESFKQKYSKAFVKINKVGDGYEAVVIHNLTKEEEQQLKALNKEYEVIIQRNKLGWDLLAHKSSKKSTTQLLQGKNRITLDGFVNSLSEWDRRDISTLPAELANLEVIDLRDMDDYRFIVHTFPSNSQYLRDLRDELCPKVVFSCLS